MIIVNTTYQVSKNFEQEWKQWVLDEYTLEVTHSGILNNPSLLRLLIENDPETVSYALQFEVDSFDLLDEWFEKHGKTLQTTMNNRFDEKVLGFTTLMEKVL